MERTTTPSPQSFMSQTLVCGAKLHKKAPEKAALLQRLGLVHLFVISGLHILFLDGLLQKLPFLMRFFILFAYGSLTSWSLPLLRAFVSFLFFQFNQKYKLFWSSLDVITLAGVVCLILQPSSFLGLSLPLSWGAALSMKIARHQSSPLSPQLMVYIGLFPLLLPLGPAHPLSLFLNFLLSFPLFLILLPFCFISFLIPSLNFDSLWTKLFVFLEKLSFLMPENHQGSWFSIFWCWLWLAMIYFLARLQK